MKKKETFKKLALSRETLVLLSSPEMQQAGGGAWSDGSICPGTTTTRGETYTQETC